MCGFVALSLQGADPVIVVEKHKTVPGTPSEHYVYLAVSGAAAGSLLPPPGPPAAAPRARVSVLKAAPGSVQDPACVDVEAQIVNPPGTSNAAALLPAAAVSCLEQAWKDPAAYLAPTLMLPPLEYKGKPIGPVSLAIPNDLELEEDADASVIDASKLVFKVIYRPWEGDPNEALWQARFLDPTAWCVASGADAGYCRAHLEAYRIALECARGNNPAACWPTTVQTHLHGPYTQAVGAATASRVEADWAARVPNGTLGCKDLPLPMAVGQVTYDAGTETLTMIFCRSNFRAMQSAGDNFRVIWLGETQLPQPPAAAPPTGKVRSSLVPFALAAGSGKPVNQVGSFRSLGQFESSLRPEGIRFSAANPKAPVANQLYVEAAVRSDRSAFPPDPSASDYKSTTILSPHLSTRQVYGFRLEGTLMQLGDVRPLKDARKWSVHVLPSISALFNSGDLAEDPNSISLKIPVEIRRTLADKGCQFAFTGGVATPNPGCSSPKVLQFFSLHLPAVLESTKTGTTKNSVFAPRGAITLRPLDAAGGRFRFGAAGGFDIGRRLTEVQFPGETKKMERPNGIARMALSSTLAVKPASPPFERFTLSFEYKFAQLFRNEIHSSPADFLVQKDNAVCAAVLKVIVEDGCVIAPAKGMVRNFAKGTRQWLNAQVSFDVTPTLAVIVAYRKGRLEPLWIYTNQVAAGIAFHLDAKAKPKAPF